MKKLAEIFISFFLLLAFFCFPSYLKATELDFPQSADSYLNLVFLVRGKDKWINNDKDWLKLQLDLITPRYPSTWLLDFDALDEKETVEKLTDYEDGQELGLLMEVSPRLASMLKLPYDKLAASHEPQNLFLSGYSKTQRKKIIDELFSSFKKEFGVYPKSIGAWFIDSWSLNYLQDKYQVRTVLMAAEQYGTDHHTIGGHPWQAPFYPSKRHSLKPAFSLEEKIDIVVIQWAAREPLRGYGRKEEYSNFSVQANDYSQKGLDKSFFERLLQAYLKNPWHDFGQLTVGIEVGQEGAEYFEEFKDLLSVVEESKKEIKIVKMADFSESFRQRFPFLAEERLVFWEDRGDWAVWFNNSSYRAGLIGDGKKTWIRDLRDYRSKQDDLFLLADKRKELFRQTEAIIDEVSLGKRWLLVDSLTKAAPKIVEDGNNFAVWLGNKEIKLNKDNLEFNFEPREKMENSLLKSDQQNGSWQFFPKGLEVNFQPFFWRFLPLVLLLLALAVLFFFYREFILPFLLALVFLSILLFEVWVLTAFNDLGLSFWTKIPFSFLGKAFLIYFFTPLLFVFLGAAIFLWIKRRFRSAFLAVLGEFLFFFNPGFGWTFPLYRKMPLDPGMIAGLKSNIVNFMWFFDFPNKEKLYYAFSPGQMYIKFFLRVLEEPRQFLIYLPLAALIFLLVNFGFLFIGVLYLFILFLKKKRVLVFTFIVFVLLFSCLTVNRLDVRLPTIGEVFVQVLGVIGLFVLVDNLVKANLFKKAIVILVFLCSLPGFFSLINRNRQLSYRLSNSWSDKGKVYSLLAVEDKSIDCFIWQLNKEANSLVYFPKEIEEHFFFDLGKIKKELDFIAENSYVLLGK